VVPEGRQVFPNLSVDEHLTAFLSNRHNSKTLWTPSRVYELFPRLAERKSNLGSQLSGGEQQMLAIGRALVTNPRLIILDEATEGLAPLIREEIWKDIQDFEKAGDISEDDKFAGKEELQKVVDETRRTLALAGLPQARRTGRADFRPGLGGDP
jgi:branched-chain amino acid transport system ATP-binding protein